MRVVSSIRRLFAQPSLTVKDKIALASAVTGIALLSALPFALSPYSLLTLRDAMTFGILAVSFDYIWGKAKVLTLGHGVFFGLGAYGLAISGTMLGFSTSEGILTGVAFATLLAGIVGYFLIFAGVRLHFFAIITIAILLIVGQVVNSWATVTGGDVGILGIPGLHFSLFGRGFDLSSAPSSYWFVLATLVVATFGLWVACRGNYGKILSAFGTNEFRATTLGYDTSLYMLLAFTVSAGLAAVSGAIYAATVGVVAPDLFSPLLSTQIILWVAIGGRGTLIGPVLAAILFTRLQQEISAYSTTLWPFIAGVIFLTLIMFAPDGLPGLAARLWPAIRTFKSSVGARHEC